MARNCWSSACTPLASMARKKPLSTVPTESQSVLIRREKSGSEQPSAALRSWSSASVSSATVKEHRAVAPDGVLAEHNSDTTRYSFATAGMTDAPISSIERIVVG